MQPGADSQGKKGLKSQFWKQSSLTQEQAELEDSREKERTNIPSLAHAEKVPIPPSRPPSLDRILLPNDSEQHIVMCIQKKNNQTNVANCEKWGRGI